MKRIILYLLAISMVSCNTEFSFPEPDKEIEYYNFPYEKPSQGKTDNVYCCIYEDMLTVLEVYNAPFTVWNESDTAETLIVDTPGVYTASYENASVVFNCSACDYEVFIPELFSPNNDASNDNFFIDGIGLINLYLEIFNSDGKLIWIQSGLESQPFDGVDMKGNRAGPGTYFYSLKVKFANGEVSNYEGEIILLM